KLVVELCIDSLEIGGCTDVPTGNILGHQAYFAFGCEWTYYSHFVVLQDLKLFLTDPESWFIEKEHHAMDGA
ncbi:MAG: hypothetical protein M1511_17625, partial [Deltaproteobacteria bacterium]|nr:hypothetical protein [Deltaproteobacteria bacterium]